MVGQLITQGIGFGGIEFVITDGLSVGEAVAVVGVGARPRPVMQVGPPPVDISFPKETFYRAIDNEASKMRSVVNLAFKEAEEEAEELKRQARYAKDEALEEIEDNLMHVHLRMSQLQTERTNIRSMQMKPRLEEARKRKKEVPAPQPVKKKKDQTPLLTRQKRRDVRKKRGR